MTKFKHHAQICKEQGGAGANASNGPQVQSQSNFFFGLFSKADQSNGPNLMIKKQLVAQSDVKQVSRVCSKRNQANEFGDLDDFESAEALI